MVHGSYICLLNSDIEVTATWLSPMMKRMLSDDRVGIVGAKLLFPHSKGDGLGLTIQHIGVARWQDGGPYHPFRGSPASIPQAVVSHEVNAVTGACMLIRRECWRDLHGFDRQFEFAQFEDVDLCWRARDKGWKIWLEAGALAYHFEHGSGENYVLMKHDSNRARLQVRWAHLRSDDTLFGVGI
jgi:GT2 family glycosyltransferase